MIFRREESEETDDYGNELPGDTAVQSVCEAQPRSSVEPARQGEFSDTEWVGFFLPADIAFLNTASAVWIPEVGDFEVDGDALPWRDPHTTRQEYVQVNLNRTAGAEDDVAS